MGNLTERQHRAADAARPIVERIHREALVAVYVDNHPGADECDIAQALHLPLLQVYHIVRELEHEAVLRRG